MGGNGARKPVFCLWRDQWERGEPITITGDGEQTRDFTSVSDVLDATIAAMTYPHPLRGQVFDIGSGEPVSLNQVAAIFGSVFENVRTFHIPERPGDSRNSQAEVGPAKEVLGWEPKIRPTDGIRDLFISWRDGV